MSFLGSLVAAYAATWLLPRLRGRAPDQWRYALAAAMAVAGLSHLFDPIPFVQAQLWLDRRAGDPPRVGLPACAHTTADRGRLRRR